VTSGEVAIHWSLFSVSAAHYISRGQVYAIYEGVVPEGSSYPATPAGAWAYNNDFYDPTYNIGGILPVAHPHPETTEWANEALEYSVEHILNAPFILYKDTTGAYEYITGLPPDIDAFVNSIAVK
jgi:hypothetical protein